MLKRLFELVSKEFPKDDDGRTGVTIYDASGTPLAWAGLDEIRFVRRIPVDRRHNAKVDYVALARLVDAGH